MAYRPAWKIGDGKVIRRDFEFVWNGGLSVTQKRRNIRALHQSVEDSTGQTVLEVSSKAEVELGRNLSAFNLRSDGVYLECIFQAAKRYENGGPFVDLLQATPRDAKTNERHRYYGNLVSFSKDGIEWPLEPRTAFYDFIYVTAVVENYGRDLDLSEYEWFTDIEFNPNKSINCQARALAEYKLLKEKNLFEVLEDRDRWLEFHREYVVG